MTALFKSPPLTWPKVVFIQVLNFGNRWKGYNLCLGLYSLQEPPGMAGKTEKGLDLFLPFEKVEPWSRSSITRKHKHQDEWWLAFILTFSHIIEHFQRVAWWCGGQHCCLTARRLWVWIHHLCGVYMFSPHLRGFSSALPQSKDMRLGELVLIKMAP